MIQFKHDKQFALPEFWSEMTLSQAERVFRAAKKLPPYVRELYALAYEEQTPDIQDRVNKHLAQVTKVDEVKNLPQVYGEIIQILSGMSDEQLEKLNRVERTTIFTNYVQTKVMGLLNYPDYEFRGLESFKVGKEEYFLPSIEEGFTANIPIPGADMVAIEFTEISDLEAASSELEGGKWEIASLIIAILCRPKVDGKREKYDQAKAIERASKFKDLPMDVVLEVFFCLAQLSTTYDSFSQTYLMEAADQEKNSHG